MGVKKKLVKCGNTLDIKITNDQNYSDKGCEIRQDMRIYIDGKPFGKLISINPDEAERLNIQNKIDQREEELEGTDNIEQQENIGKEIEKLEDKKEEVVQKQNEKKQIRLKSIIKYAAEMQVTIRPFYFPSSNEERPDILISLQKKTFYDDQTFELLVEQILEHDLFNDDLRPIGFNFLPLEMQEYLNQVPIVIKEEVSRITAEKQHFKRYLRLFSNLNSLYTHLTNIISYDELPQTNLGELNWTEKFVTGIDLSIINDPNKEFGSFDKTLALRSGELNFNKGDIIGTLNGRLMDTEFLRNNQFDWWHPRLAHFKFPKVLFPENKIFCIIPNQKEVLLPETVTGLLVDTFQFQTYSDPPHLIGLFMTSKKVENTNCEVVAFWKKINVKTKYSTIFQNIRGETYELRLKLRCVKEIKQNEPFVVKRKLHYPYIAETAINDFEEPLQEPTFVEEPEPDIPFEPTEGKQPADDEEPTEDEIPAVEPKFNIGDTVSWIKEEGKKFFVIESYRRKIPKVYRKENEKYTQNSYTISTTLPETASQRTMEHEAVPENELSPFKQKYIVPKEGDIVKWKHKGQWFIRKYTYTQQDEKGKPQPILENPRGTQFPAKFTDKFLPADNIERQMFEDQEIQLEFAKFIKSKARK